MLFPLHFRISPPSRFLVVTREIKRRKKEGGRFVSISCQEQERRGGEEGLSLYCRREEGWRQSNSHFPFPSPLYNPFRLWKKREISGKRDFFKKVVLLLPASSQLLQHLLTRHPHSRYKGFFLQQNPTSPLRIFFLPPTEHFFPTTPLPEKGGGFF